MPRLIVVSLAAVIAACAPSGGSRDTASSAQSPPSQAAPPKPLPKACEIITPGEIAGALQVPEVKKDELNSGENQMTHVDICNWYVKPGTNEGIQVQVYRAQGADEGSALLAYSSAKGEAVEHDSARAAQAVQLTGIGEEAIYSPYPVGKGGNIAFRTRSGAVTITGSASRDSLEAVAKLAASRM